LQQYVAFRRKPAGRLSNRRGTYWRFGACSSALTASRHTGMHVTQSAADANTVLVESDRPASRCTFTGRSRQLSPIVIGRDEAQHKQHPNWTV
jgi:hypothetical protein